jgi:hypothetical protein
VISRLLFGDYEVDRGDNCTEAMDKTKWEINRLLCSFCCAYSYLDGAESVESCCESEGDVDRVPVLEDFVASLSVFRVMSLSCARINSHTKCTHVDVQLCHR